MLPFLIAIVRFFRVLYELAKSPDTRVLLTFAGIILGMGTIFYHEVEGWRYLDALYFCVITLTTIGFGDFSPQTDLGKAFTIFYVFIGVGLFVGLINIVATIRHRHDQSEN